MHHLVYLSLQIHPHFLTISKRLPSQVPLLRGPGVDLKLKIVTKMPKPLNTMALLKAFRNAQRKMKGTEHQLAIGGYATDRLERQLAHIYARVMYLGTKIESIRRHRQHIHLQKRITQLT